MKSGIYSITNVNNGRIYIGSAVDINARWLRHTNTLNDNKHHNKPLQRAWIKYGSDSFKFDVVCYIEPEFLLEVEQRFIDKHFGLTCYNICPTAGSPKGIKRSKKFKNKVSESLKGRPRSEETKRKIRESLKGKAPWNKGKPGWIKNVHKSINT